MPRPDLLALTLDDLATLTNRGTVKRAERELDEIACTVAEKADGTITFTWADGIVSTIAGNKVVAQGTCTCPATEMCRHLVRAVLAYRKQYAAQDEGTPQSWNPGAVADELLAKHFKPAALTRLRERFGQGLVVELVRGTKPSAFFHDPPCLVRFLVPGDLRYTHCDCSETPPCSHVPLAVWAFRRLDEQRASGMIAIENESAPVPAALLDEAEQALLDWTEVGLSGAGSVWKDRLAQLERRCRAEGLLWPAETLAELQLQLDRYARRDALFQPLRVPELVGEFLARADAIRNRTGAVPQLFLRGATSDRPLEIGSARYIGLGCDAILRKRSVELAAYLQDADSGSVVAITRDFTDSEGDERPPLSRLADTPVLKGAPFRQVSGGQLLVQGGKRSADHRLVVGRARAHVNPQSFAWEKLRAPLLAESFAEVSARLAVLPPASLRPRRIVNQVFVCPIQGVEAPVFDPVSQCVIARLIDASDVDAYLEHPYTSTGADGAELLLHRLAASPAAARFVAGIVQARPHGLSVRPTCVVFEDGAARSAVQPWIDRAPKAPSVAAAKTDASSEVDDVQHYLQQLHEFVADLYLSGLGRCDPLAARRARELAAQGDSLGFTRLHRPLAQLAEQLEAKRKRTTWAWRPAGSLLLLQSVLLRLALDLS